MANRSLTIFFPCYNEEGNLRELVNRIRDSLQSNGIRDYEVILIDDGSHDGTGRVIGELSDTYPWIIPVHHRENQGIPAGWRSGLRRSRGRIVLTTDADLQYAPEDIPALFQECTNGPWDMVQGWRKNYTRKDRLRKMLSVGFSGMLRVIFSLQLHDVKSGFIAYRSEVFQDILDHRFRYFSFQSLPTVAGHFKGYRIKQLPITFHQRRTGKSSIVSPFVFSFRSALDLPKALLEYRCFKQRPQGHGKINSTRQAGIEPGCAINDN